MKPLGERKPGNLLLLLSGVSLLARLLFLGRKSFWIDECLAWGAVRLDWTGMISSISSGTPHPPIAFIVMKISSLLPGSDEFGLRLLIAVLVASAVIPVFRLASRRTTARGGFWAGMVWALSPFAVSLGQEAWVYGVNIAVSLWFADLADMAWRGSIKALIGTLFLGVTGILTQHIFVLTVAAGSVLYFTIDRGERISLKRFILVPGILALMYAPVFLFFSAQFTERSSRMAAAGMSVGFSRLLSTQPFSQFFRILSGGILPEISSNLLDRPRMLTAYLLNAVIVLALALWPFFTCMLRSIERRYLWLCLLIPFGLYITDGPTVRQIAILWIPISISSAAVFSRYRWSGIAISLLCLLALIPYYRMDVFPYHRSNWRDAVATVESSALPGDVVVIVGGKSTSFAWECYSETGVECLTPGGNDPFAAERDRTSVDSGFLIDSLLTEGRHERVWVILDVWGASSVHSIKGMHQLVFSLPAGENMEIGLLESTGRE